jgi:transketolase
MPRAARDTNIAEESLTLKSLRYRRRILQVIKQAGAGHTGGGLSCIDILNVLYNRILQVTPAGFRDPRRDRYIQSKGHCVEALYVVLADKGFFAASELATVCQYQSHFVGHPTRKVPGVEQNTGALGHGLSLATGTALGSKLDRLGNRVFTLLGDGELAEGSNWEAAMSAAHYRLDNLVAIVDRNSLQISGRTRDVCNSEPLAEKFAAFGWSVRTVDGHDLEALSAALGDPADDGKPTAVLADTVKGRGVSFMEDVAKWHHGVPNEDEYKRALEEIDAAISGLSGTGTA